MKMETESGIKMAINMFNAVHTTDWHEPETLEHWREQWAAAVNTKFEEKGLDVRIDHRSYVRQGLDLIPTVHEGAKCPADGSKGHPHRERGTEPLD